MDIGRRTYLDTIELKINKINRNSFKNYGEVLEVPENKPTHTSNCFDIWMGFEEIITKNNKSKFSWFKVKHRNDFKSSNIERHLNTSEALIPVRGQSVIIVGLPGEKGSGEIIQKDSLKAFYIDGTKGINLKPGIWHWIPFPLEDEADFLLIFADRTDKDDCEVIDLTEKMGIELKIIL